MSTTKVHGCPVSPPPINTEDPTQDKLDIGVKIKEDVREEYMKLPEKFSVVTSLMKWGDVIPFVDQIMAGGRVLLSATEALDAVGCGGKYLIERVILKNSPDKTDLKRSYYQVSMSIARLVRADFSMGIFPFGTFTWAWINKIILLAWNVFGSLESRLVVTEPGKCIGDNAPAFVPLKFRKGVIFTLGSHASNPTDKLKGMRASRIAKLEEQKAKKASDGKNTSDKAKKMNLFKRVGLSALKNIPFMKERYPEPIGSPVGSEVPTPVGSDDVENDATENLAEMLSHEESEGSEVDEKEAVPDFSEEEISHNDSEVPTSSGSPEGSQVDDMEFSDDNEAMPVGQDTE